MAFNTNATIIPGKGTVLVADPDTAVPTDYKTLDPTNETAMNDATTGTAKGWKTMGHTSRENTVALSKEGGEATQIGSWWDEALRSQYAPTNWNIGINSLQVDSLTLGLAFGGGTLDTTKGSYAFGDIVPQKKALYVLIIDSGGNRMAFYIPNTTVSIGDAPELPTDSFFEIQLSAAMLNSATTGKRLQIFHPALEAA